jgi:hypothetical protein
MPNALGYSQFIAFVGSKLVCCDDENEIKL